MGVASELGKRFRVEFAARVIYVVSSGLLTVVLARLLGPDGYGLMFLAISVLGILKLFSQLGIGGTTGKYIATYREQDSTQIPHILRFGFLLNIAIIIIVAVILLFTYDSLAEFVGEPELAPFLLIGVVYISVSALKTFARRSLQGFEAIEASALIHGVRGAGKFVFAVGFVLLGFGALGAFVGYTLGYVAASIVGLGYLYVGYYRKSDCGDLEPGLQRRIAEYSIPTTATIAADTVDRYFDTLLIGFFIGPIAVSFYTISKQVISFTKAPVSALGFTLSPTYESQSAAGNPEKAARIYEEGIFHTLLIYIPAAAGLFLVAEPLIELVFGSDYLEAVPVLQILSLYLVFLSITELTSSGLNYLGRARDRAIIRAVTAGLNVVLNLMLIPWIGVIGAAIATVVTYGLYTYANAYIMSIELDIRVGWLLRKILLVIIITSIMSATVYIFVGYVTGFVTLFATVGVGITVWMALIIRLEIVDVKELISNIA